MDIIETLKILSNAFGAPGFEEEVRNLIKNYLPPLVDDWKIDPLGNLLAFKKGKSDFSVMVDAHMDEVAFMVTHIEETGFVRLTSLGGWDVRILPSHSITLQTREHRKIQGVIGSVPPHILSTKDQEKVMALETLFVDLGTTSKKETLEWGVRVGDPAVIYYPFEFLGSNTVRGKAFDDRVGCTLALLLLEALREETLPYNLTVSFSICEEVGLRGAQTAAYQIKPDIALVLEGTVGADVPGVSLQKQPSALGKGPAITVADRRTIVPREIVVLLEDLARKKKIPCQLKVPGSGGNDAGAIHLSRQGVPTAVLNVPCRYIHSPFNVARVEDIKNTFELSKAFLLEGVEKLRTLYRERSSVKETSDV